MQAIKVKHNIEMAHRLWELPGKCTQLHGHSWWCELTIEGIPDERGILFDFSTVKKKLRDYLDQTYDHHLALDGFDPLIKYLTAAEMSERYPGVLITPGMPTVENMSRWIGEWAQNVFGIASNGHSLRYHVQLWEAATNAAIWCD